MDTVSEMDVEKANAEVEAMFRELDMDRNGKISAEELKSKLEEMQGAPIALQAVQAFMKLHDKDNDKLWSMSELADFLAHCR
ncbi:uncharacterized protein DEA37_0008553 [Paragonimus westermani]|uniref:EF-hand domain-containing protein n=1 Tax=Paragonimus westermani TaxID=34504 RepID=A0A5J4NDD6_9TREM|nr:uncharacterized protein DEA37_0008553 [Paragonimus westermani]